VESAAGFDVLEIATHLFGPGKEKKTTCSNKPEAPITQMDL